MTDGVAGHASLPKMGDNALLKLAPLLERLGARQPSLRRHRGAPQALLDGLGVTFDGRSQAAGPASWRCCSSRCSASRSRRRCVRAREKINVIPAAPSCTSTAACRPASATTRCARRSPRCSATRPTRASRRVHRAGRRQRLAARLAAACDAIDGWIAQRRSRARRRADDPARLHRLAHVPRGVPRLRRLRLLPAQATSRCTSRAPLVHGADERIDVRDLGLAAASSPTPAAHCSATRDNQGIADAEPAD